jgi:hypothetical protein
MAAKRSWLLRVPEIRQDVAALDVPVLDRLLFERLFHVRRRRAIQLMHVLGGYQTGQVLLIDRAVLLQQLEALEAGTEFALEHGRKQRLLDSLEKVQRHRAAAAVRIPAASETSERSVAHLPAGVLLEADSLHVDFKGAEDLLGKLYELAQTVGDDFESFRAIVERPT